jgi:hypothetical protein
MSPRPASQFEEFLALFEAARVAARHEPKRLRTFYNQSSALRESIEALDGFMIRTDFERRVFHGRQKAFSQVPHAFPKAWAAYVRDWQPVLNLLTLQELGLLPEDAEPSPASQPAPNAPDPESEEDFDPRWHQGGSAMRLGYDRLIDQVERYEGQFEDSHIANASRIALEAWDYLEQSIGLDLASVFERWREVPVYLMPAHVSNRHGHTELNGLHALLADAIRAYVAGAPLAAMMACRSLLEIVLRDHYCQGESGKLAELIVLASRRFDHVDQKRLDRLRKEANRVVHEYGSAGSRDLAGNRAIIEFLKTLKFLIQTAPTRPGHQI